MQSFIEKQKQLFESYCQKRFAQVREEAQSHLSLVPESAVIFEAMEYSFFSGGKRFRPLLGLALAEALQIEPTQCYPWLLAIEMVHTYSLIHDDLPAMDNSDMRRGRPSCHKQFGEDLAILAGDALYAQAFWEITHAYRTQLPSQIMVELTRLLSAATGPCGIILGQVMDIQSKTNRYSKEQVLRMHQLKTGFLFQIVLKGVGIIGELSTDILTQLEHLGYQLGLAFQIKDDLLDSEETIEVGSLPATLGLNETKNLLAQIQAEMMKTLQNLEISRESSLAQLVELNQSRHL